MFPRSVSGLAVKVQALVLFSVVAGYSTLDMIGVGPKEVFGQKTTMGNDQDSMEPRIRLSLGRAEVFFVAGLFSRSKSPNRRAKQVSHHKGAGGTGGEFEKGFHEKNQGRAN